MLSVCWFKTETSQSQQRKTIQAVDYILNWGIILCELHISSAGSSKRQGSWQNREAQVIGTHLEKKKSNQVEKEADPGWIIPYHFRQDDTGVNRVCCDVWMHTNTQSQSRDSGHLAGIG